MFFQAFSCTEFFTFLGCFKAQVDLLPTLRHSVSFPPSLKNGTRTISPKKGSKATCAAEPYSRNLLICICVQWRKRRFSLILLMWRIRWVLNNASKWEMRFYSAFKGLRNRFSVVCTLTRLKSERSGVRIPTGQETFLSNRMSKPALGHKPDS
jgi:hypothetical protein